MSNDRGFTMPELLISVAVIAILLALALPAFNSLVLDNRITTMTNRFVADLRLARSEALKRGARVIVCRSNDVRAASPTCGGDSQTWTQGWLIFANTDANTIFDTGTDTLLKVGEGISDTQLSIISNSSGDASISFNPDASTNQGGATLHWALCDSRGASHGRRIEVPPTGRPRLLAADSCSNPA